jgi:hypothetical protein
MSILVELSGLPQDHANTTGVRIDVHHRTSGNNSLPMRPQRGTIPDGRRVCTAPRCRERSGVLRCFGTS